MNGKKVLNMPAENEASVHVLHKHWIIRAWCRGQFSIWHYCYYKILNEAEILLLHFIDAVTHWEWSLGFKLYEMVHEMWSGIWISSISVHSMYSFMYSRCVENVNSPAPYRNVTFLRLNQEPFTLHYVVCIYCLNYCITGNMQKAVGVTNVTLVLCQQHFSRFRKCSSYSCSHNLIFKTASHKQPRMESWSRTVQGFRNYNHICENPTKVIFCDLQFLWFCDLST